ncbi:hypothetical protein B0O99DRAFT_678922 [Bisporella sp. PMI_857]|nr:hypothetical protein B0O99DRAFT_678922 [Bisporella sp. PMI_857]
METAGHQEKYFAKIFDLQTGEGSKEERAGFSFGKTRQSCRRAKLIFQAQKICSSFHHIVNCVRKMDAEVITEAVKKRGRPKKVVLEGEPVKTTTRAKSTKTATTKTKAAKAPSAEKPAATTVTPVKKIAKASTATTGTSKPISSSSAKSKVEPKIAEPAPKAPSSPPTSGTTSEPTENIEVKIGDSKILNMVQEKHGLPTNSAKTSTITTKSANNSSSKATISSKLPAHAPAQSTAKPAKPATSPLSPPKSAPKIPIAALNSKIVDNISTRAGARPNVPGSKPLPPNYNYVARRVTAIIIALPILIVSSYALWQQSPYSSKSREIAEPNSKMKVSLVEPKANS